VDRANGSERERLAEDEVPEGLRVGPPDALGAYDWRIVPASTCPWVTALEGRLPGSLPPSFRSLVRRYLFPAFQISDVRLFANTGAGAVSELADVVLRDQVLSRILLDHGLVQFGRYRDRYDPVCFDLRSRRGGGECPVVVLDHEAALIGGRAVVTHRLADSFLALIAAP
jgi:hypothetical protein